MRKIEKLKKHKKLTFDLTNDELYSSTEEIPHLTKQERNILNRTNWAKTTNVNILLYLFCFWQIKLFLL